MLTDHTTDTLETSHSTENVEKIFYDFLLNSNQQRTSVDSLLPFYEQIGWLHLAADMCNGGL